jgi:hypothetical protein
MRNKILTWLGIVDYLDAIDSLEDVIGHRFVRFFKHGDYVGEPGTVMGRLLELEKKVYKK